MKKVFLIIATALLMVGCGKKSAELISSDNFNKQVDGKQVSLYTLKNGDITMQVTNFGGRVVALWTPDRRGNYADIVLGYDNLDAYLNNSGERYLGAVVGRCANRIGQGKFVIDSVEYQLPQNDGQNTLHGGTIGADMVVWDVVSSDDSTLVMHVILPDGQDGFPGNLDVTMTYSLTKDNEFVIKYNATTDKPTLCNFSHHSFFNLRGKGDILNEILQINSRYMTPIDSNLVTNGRYEGVKGTALDFIDPHKIGDSINSDYKQVRFAKGYDHNWIIDKTSIDAYAWDATLSDPKSGRELQVWSDQPGLQFYSGNFFDGKTEGKNGNVMKRHSALALETQYYPDAINHANYPAPILRPGEEYKQMCVYKFGVVSKNKK